MTDTTPRLDLPLLVPGQAQKEVTINDALERLDALTLARLEGVTASPPPSAASGELWIVGEAPSGAFAGEAGALALRGAGGWRFLHVAEGTTLPAKDGALWRRVSSGWVRADVWTPLPAPAAGEVADVAARSAIDRLATVLDRFGLLRAAPSNA